MFDRRRLARGDREVRPRACARSARPCWPASTPWATRSTSGCCAPTRREVRERLPAGDGAIARAIGDLDDAALLAALRDLGGHDLGALLEAYRATDAVADRPSVVFAYTIKGWRLPTEGHPSNHSALLTEPQLEELAVALGTDPEDPWRGFAEGSAEAELCAAAAARLARPPVPLRAPPPVPAETTRRHTGSGSTQQALGRLLLDLVHEAPEVAARVVTVSPDVGTSTNLGGWINRAGIWSLGERIDWFADDRETLVRWREDEHGRHVELGIAEVNLVGLLGELGATWSRDGEPLLPVGHDLRPVRDPRARAMVVRDLRRRPVDPGRDPQRCDARPGGRRPPVRRDPVDRHRAARLRELGAGLHAGLRVGLPACAGAARPPRRDGVVLPALDPPARPGAGGRGAPGAAGGRARRRLRAAPARRGGGVGIVCVGAVVPEALAAADELGGAEVVLLTSPDLVFRALQARWGLRDGDDAILGPALRRAPPARHGPGRAPALARASWPPSTACPWRASGSPSSGSRATSPTSTATTGSTPRRSSAPRSTSRADAPGRATGACPSCARGSCAPVQGVSLTFDDGPDPRWTPAVLEALEAEGLRATFYVVSPRAAAAPGPRRPGPRRRPRRGAARPRAPPPHRPRARRGRRRRPARARRVGAARRPAVGLAGALGRDDRARPTRRPRATACGSSGGTSTRTTGAATRPPAMLDAVAAGLARRGRRPRPRRARARARCATAAARRWRSSGSSAPGCARSGWPPTCRRAAA